jgi:basic amino acid/polyamine antiporter, APA family
VTDRDAGLVRHLRLHSATGLVVASMIGAGIFTTTGYQAADLGHPGYIFALWVLGGILALCGALAFAELGASLPRAGAEYVYIREAFGPPFAFMSAIIALIAGFSAPIAAAVKALIDYLAHFVPIFGEQRAVLGPIGLNDCVAAGVCWALVGVHAWGAQRGIRFADLVTALKILGIVAIIVAAFAVGKGSAENLTRVSPVYAELSTVDTIAAFATALIFVSFCYLGWNGAAYLAAEMPNPQRVLPRSLLIGTAFVMVLYLLLNAVFFYGADAAALAGHADVGLIAARELFSPAGVSMVVAVMAVSILASASAMTAMGPRVYFAFGQDLPALRLLAKADPATGAPRNALVLQGFVTTAIIFSGGIGAIIQYTGFTLTLFSSLAVAAAVVLRIRQPNLPRPFRMPFYPWPVVFYLAVSAWTLVWAVRGRPVESLLGLATAAAAGFAFLLIGRNTAKH